MSNQRVDFFKNLLILLHYFISSLFLYVSVFDILTLFVFVFISFSIFLTLIIYIYIYDFLVY